MGNKQGKLKRRGVEERPSVTASSNERKRSIFAKSTSTASSAPPPPPPPPYSDLPPSPISPQKHSLDESEYQLKTPALETQELVERTHFTAREIDSIRENIFSLLGYTLSPTSYHEITISKEEFMKFLGVPTNSLFPNRLFAIFDVSKRDVLSFSDLVRGLSILSQKATRDEKLLMAFQFLDPNGSGYITKESTVSVLKSCLEESKEIFLSDDQIEKLVASTFQEADLDKNGVIDFREYQALDSRHPGLLEFLTVDTSGILNSLDKQKSALSMTQQ